MNEEDYEMQWEDLDEKVILAQILAELQQIRVELTEAETSDTDDSEVYWCTRCPGDAHVPRDKREAHARSEHNTPPNHDLDSMYMQVE